MLGEKKQFLPVEPPCFDVNVEGMAFFVPPKKNLRQSWIGESFNHGYFFLNSYYSTIILIGIIYYNYR